MLSRRVRRARVSVPASLVVLTGCAGRFEFVKLFVKLRFTGAGYAIKASVTLGTGEQSEKKKKLLVVAIGVQWWCCFITLLVISGVQVCVCACMVCRLKNSILGSRLFPAFTFECLFLSGCLLAP